MGFHKVRSRSLGRYWCKTGCSEAPKGLCNRCELDPLALSTSSPFPRMSAWHRHYPIGRRPRRIEVVGLPSEFDLV